MDIRANYNPRTDVDLKRFKKDTLKYVCGNYDDGRKVTKDDIFDVFIPLWNALKSVDFDMNLFFSQKLYKGVSEDWLCGYLMTVCLFYANPISVYLVDWMNGYLDFDFVNPDIAAGAEWHPANEIEKLEYLWYCKKDEDIWWMLGQGIGNIKDMYEWYMGDKIIPSDLFNIDFPPCYFIKDEKKALDMILYLEHTIGVTNKAVANHTRCLYNNVNTLSRIWKLMLPELTEKECDYLARKYNMTVAQISKVTQRFTKTMNDLPHGYGMDMMTRMTMITDYCYTALNEND